ncbi:MAG: hypothetical protein DI536_14855 [Archangium gephyra]|uniref:Uncharacterized protein n=1 Tax=Archangium gephyra TaxID=48 RepID=A0A2W5TNJ7_9BACT|nr:MAG: hypothetical protein DI536_14855 [Archangium gephyra]
MFTGMSKRQKELARQEHQKEKAAKAAQRKTEKESKGPRDPNAIDPDIAHIIPGPQPIPEE